MLEIKGAVPVLAMPFDEDGAIDEDSLRREIDFCVEAGSQAICFGIGSESNQLTDAERAQVWTLAARHLEGLRSSTGSAGSTGGGSTGGGGGGGGGAGVSGKDRVPLVVATSHASREGTIALTRLARECGADCAMVNPPRGGDALVSLFRELSERVGLPLMIQDAGGNAPAEVLLRAAQEGRQVVAGKLESPGAVLKIARFVEGLRAAGLLSDPHRGGPAQAAQSGPLPLGEGYTGTEGRRPGEGSTGTTNSTVSAGRVTVLGGAGGNWLPEELEAGSVGTMPHPAIIDAFRTVCDRYAAGDSTGGLETYRRQIAPHLRAVAVAGPGAGDGGGTMVWVHKALLQRAGVLRTTYCRSGNTPAPAAVIDKVWEHAQREDLLVARRAGRR
jgi:hypothetical protein